MSHDEREEIIAQLRAAGTTAMVAEEWTPERALSVLRENRRRYANTREGMAVNSWGAGFAEDVTQQTGLAPADISAVLLYASSWLGGLAAVNNLPAVAITNVMGAAADELHQQANGCEQP
ncbi:hypothetical protein [Streptomyces sp. NPDC002520]